MTAQEHILSLLTDHNLSIAWLASKLGTYRQKLHSKLCSATDLPTADYLEIMRVLQNEGYTRKSSAAECKVIQGEALDTVGGICQEISNLNAEVQAVVADGYISALERQRLIMMIDAMQGKVTGFLNELKECVKNEG